MKPCVIFNPAARGEKARQFREQLGRLSDCAELKPTYATGSGRGLAAQAVRDGHDLLVAAGGDGTVNEVINGIGEVPWGFERIRLGVLPLGTINVFARELGLPMAFEPAWQVIQKANETCVDLGQAEYVQDGRAQQRYFAQLAGAGLDSRAIELVDWEQKKSFGPLAYVMAGFKALREERPKITLTVGGVERVGELVLIGNGRYYGGNFEIFPKANLRDGLLDLTVFPKVNWEILLRAGWGWLTDQLHSAAGCEVIQAASFRLSAAADVPFELDGENVGSLPATFSVRTEALRVLVP